MNTEKTIENSRKVGGDYFRLGYVRRSNLKLEYFINQFNPEDYWIYKATRNQVLVSTQELLDFKYSVYVLFRKDIYNSNEINDWIRFVGSLETFMYLVKPFPPNHIKERIRKK